MMTTSHYLLENLYIMAQTEDAEFRTSDKQGGVYLILEKKSEASRCLSKKFNDGRAGLSVLWFWVALPIS